MATNHSPRALPKLDLTTVEVTLEQAKVYRNGLQQARVRLDLESKHGGKPSDLTPREIESIQLFDYHNTESGTIPFSDDGSAQYRGWSAQRVYRGYVSQTDALGKPQTRPRYLLYLYAKVRECVSRIGALGKPRGRQSYFLYLSAHADAVETIDVSFRIHGDDLSIWRTNGKVTIAGIEQTVASMDKKIGITMTPVPPVRYPASSFTLDRRALDNSGHAGGGRAAAVFDDIVSVTIRLADQTTLGVRRMTCDPAGLIHWINKLPGTRNPCFTGYAQPGETTIHWNEAMNGHLGSTPPPTELESPETDSGVIVLCGRLDIPTWVGAPEEPVKVTMTDAHGSVQTCHIGFVRGERDELIVT